MMAPPRQHMQFDTNQYPDIKPTKPRNKVLRLCPVCKKPGYIYLFDKKGTKFIYYIHYNEPPIGLTTLRGRPIRFRYRRCTRDGRTYSTMEEAFAEAEQGNLQHENSKFRGIRVKHPGEKRKVPKGKRLTTCPRCDKLGYRYKTYFEHSNEPPISPRKLRGIQKGWRYRRCSLMKGKVNRHQGDKKLRLATQERETEKSIRNKLDKYIGESDSSTSKGDNSALDYKKLYLDLIDKLRKIVVDADGIRINS